MWCGRSTKRSQYMSGFLKPDSASRRALANASGISASLRTTRIPRPPPPPARLENDGVANAVRFADCVLGVSKTALPVTGSPKRAAFVRAVTLSPQARIASGEGPMNVIPHFAQILANSAFSERKPYPG